MVFLRTGAVVKSKDDVTMGDAVDTVERIFAKHERRIGEGEDGDEAARGSHGRI